MSRYIGKRRGKPFTLRQQVLASGVLGVLGVAIIGAVVTDGYRQLTNRISGDGSELRAVAETLFYSCSGRGAVIEDTGEPIIMYDERPQSAALGSGGQLR